MHYHEARRNATGTCLALSFPSSRAVDVARGQLLLSTRHLATSPLSQAECSPLSEVVLQWIGAKTRWMEFWFSATDNIDDDLHMTGLDPLFFADWPNVNYGQPHSWHGSMDRSSSSSWQEAVHCNVVLARGEGPLTETFCRQYILTRGSVHDKGG